MYARYRRLSVHTKRWGKICSFLNRSWYQDTQRIVVSFFKRFGLYSWPRYLTLRNWSLDKVFTQRLNIFEEKCILDKKKTHYEPTETFLDTHFISLFLTIDCYKQLPYKVEPLIILPTTSSQVIICDENVVQSDRKLETKLTGRDSALQNNMTLPQKKQ